ncbi:MAG: hypothetical protein EOM20_01575 [Spartobacteria bacterium]|nr:hypothetical protein [Spartobacteria bacterium]
MTHCPVCHRQLEADGRTSAECPRCKADLQPCFDIIDKAEHIGLQALACLSAEPDKALKLAQHAVLLHRTKQTQRIHALAMLRTGHSPCNL